MQKILDLFKFIRIKICVFITSIAITGFLLFNPFSINLLFVILACFFIIAGGYAYNNITDKKEDIINRKNINPFSYNNYGKIIVILCFLLGIFLSLFLPIYSIFFVLSVIILGIFYSLFRIKKIFPFKNIYTSLVIMQFFLIGASNITIEIIEYSLFISVFIFILSLISDLRDYNGDKKENIKTLPVYFGYEKTKVFVFILLGIFCLIISFSKVFILLPFALTMKYFLFRNNFSYAHSCGGFSFVFLSFWLVIGGV